MKTEEKTKQQQQKNKHQNEYMKLTTQWNVANDNATE